MRASDWKEVLVYLYWQPELYDCITVNGFAEVEHEYGDLMCYLGGLGWCWVTRLCHKDEVRFLENRRRQCEKLSGVKISTRRKYCFSC